MLNLCGHWDSLRGRVKWDYRSTCFGESAEDRCDVLLGEGLTQHCPWQLLGLLFAAWLLRNRIRNGICLIHIASRLGGSFSRWPVESCFRHGSPRLSCWCVVFPKCFSLCFTSFRHCVPGCCDSCILSYSSDLGFDVLAKLPGPGLCLIIIRLLLPPSSTCCFFGIFWPHAPFLCILPFVFTEMGKFGALRHPESSFERIPLRMRICSNVALHLTLFWMSRSAHISFTT